MIMKWNDSPTSSLVDNKAVHSVERGEIDKIMLLLSPRSTEKNSLIVDPVWNHIAIQVFTRRKANMV